MVKPLENWITWLDLHQSGLLRGQVVVLFQLDGDPDEADHDEDEEADEGEAVVVEHTDQHLTLERILRLGDDHRFSHLKS